MKINEKTLNKVRTSAYALSIENTYKNVAYFSGWIISKPNIIKNDKTGRESVSLILVQFTRDNKGCAYFKTYSLLSYVTPVIEMWKTQEKVCFVICDAQLQYNPKTKQVYPHVYEMKITHNLDMKLEESEK